MSEMTAIRMASVATLALCWLLAAALLWRTTGPDGTVPELDASRLWGQALLARNARYEYGHATLWALGLAAQLVALGLLARRRPDAPGALAVRGALIGLLVYAVAWLADLPFDLAGHWWRRRHDVSELGYGGYLLGP